MKTKYQSRILQAIHEDAKGMHELGIISDERMRYYDGECLVQEPKTTDKVATSATAKTGHVGRISAKGTGG